MKSSAASALGLATAMSTSPSARPHLQPDDWDTLRLAFQSSTLAEATLVSLAQNIDGCAWPVDAADERASAYIDLSYEDALARLHAQGLPPSRLDTLADILRATLAFDESFGAMTGIASAAEAAADPIQRNLARLGIPPDFPISLCAISSETLDFCFRERIHTLGAFIDFSRNVSRAVIIGGEFRSLFNALVHLDEHTLAKHLPYRPHASGLFLIESLGHLVRPLDIEQRVALARRPTEAPPELLVRARRRVDYFASQLATMRGQHAQGIPLSRFVVSLDDFSLESAVAALLGLHLAAPVGAPPPPSPPPALAAPRSLAWLRRWLPKGP